MSRREDTISEELFAQGHTEANATPVNAAVNVLPEASSLPFVWRPRPWQSALVFVALAGLTVLALVLS